MSRRIEIELTSKKDDGSWTWRAAGAKQPKGTLEGGLLYEGAGVGDVVRADADFELEGITVTAVLPPKGPRKEAERIEIISRPVEGGVTSQLARKPRDEKRGGKGGRREGRDGDDRRPRGGGGPRGSGGPGGDRKPRGERPDRPRRERPERPAEPPKPKPKRLRPARTHRNAVLAELDEKQKPVAEQVLKGGIPAVRTWVTEQSGGADPTAMVALAEDLLPRLRTAEWRDRADAALKDIDELDLRDIRSVVVAASDAAKDDETRALAQQVKDGLAARVEKEHTAWLDEITTTLADGRVVRALRLSSRPPKAGAVFPPELADRLATAAGEALTSDVAQDRWGAVLEAVALAPVHRKVVPGGIPPEPKEELLSTVKQVSMQVPEIAALFGVEPAPAPRRPRPPRGGKKPAAGGGRTVSAGKGARRQQPVPEAEAKPATGEPSSPPPAPVPEPETEAPAGGPVRSASAPAPKADVADAPAAEAAAAEPTPADEPVAEHVEAEQDATPEVEAAEQAAEAEAPEELAETEPQTADDAAADAAIEPPDEVAEAEPEPEPEPEVAPEPVAEAPEPTPDAPEPVAEAEPEPEVTPEPVAEAPEPTPAAEPDAPEPEPEPQVADEPAADAATVDVDAKAESPAET
jgi:hypothetical protein